MLKKYHLQAKEKKDEKKMDENGTKLGEFFLLFRLLLSLYVYLNGMYTIN